MSQPINRYNITVAVEKYTKDGKERNKYMTIGEAVEFDDGGITGKIYTVPLNRDYKFNLYLKENKPAPTTDPNRGE